MGKTKNALAGIIGVITGATLTGFLRELAHGAIENTNFFNWITIGVGLGAVIGVLILTLIFETEYAEWRGPTTREIVSLISGLVALLFHLPSEIQKRATEEAGEDVSDLNHEIGVKIVFGLIGLAIGFGAVHIIPNLPQPYRAYVIGGILLLFSLGIMITGLIYALRVLLYFIRLGLRFVGN